jgi:hypothetical protein
MKFGNDSKVGLATLIPLILLVAAIALFVIALVVNDGDVEKAGTWATAVAVGFFGLLATIVRLAQSPDAKRDAPLTIVNPAAAATNITAATGSASAPGSDPLDPPAIDEPPTVRTDAPPA